MKPSKNFGHATTAQLSLNAQNYDQIRRLEWKLRQKSFSNDIAHVPSKHKSTWVPSRDHHGVSIHQQIDSFQHLVKYNYKE